MNPSTSVFGGSPHGRIPTGFDYGALIGRGVGASPTLPVSSLVQMENLAGTRVHGRPTLDLEQPGVTPKKPHQLLRSGARAHGRKKGIHDRVLIERPESWMNKKLNAGVSVFILIFENLVVRGRPSVASRQHLFEHANNISIQEGHPSCGQLFVATNRVKMSAPSIVFQATSALSRSQDGLIPEGCVEKHQGCTRVKGRDQERVLWKSIFSAVGTGLCQSVEIMKEVHVVGLSRIEAAGRQITALRASIDHTGLCAGLPDDRKAGICRGFAAQRQTGASEIEARFFGGPAQADGRAGKCPDVWDVTGPQSIHDPAGHA